MMSRKLCQLNIPTEVTDRLAKVNIRLCKDVLSRSAIELVRISDCSYSQIQSLIQACSAAVLPKMCNALQLRQQGSRDDGSSDGRHIPTFIPALDNMLRGGLQAGTITEITGPPGSGKTQFCLMLSTLVSSNVDKERGVIYIDTEGAFSPQRLLEMLQSSFPNMDSICVEKALSNVNIINTLSCSTLLKSLESIEELVISKNVRLIAIDSIASLMRKEFSSASQSIIERTNLLTQVASILKYTAEVFCIPVIVTNQTTTQFKYDAKINQEKDTVPRDDDPAGDRTEGQGDLIAALGNTWSHSVNTRLILQYLPRSGTAGRQILVAKSPVSGFGAVTCVIQDKGLVQIGDDAIVYQGTDPGLQTIVCKGQVAGIQTDSFQQFR